MIDHAIPAGSGLIVRHAPRKAFTRLLRNQWRNLSRNGWRCMPYQAGDIWQRLNPRHAAPAAIHAPGQEFDESALKGRSNIPILKVSDIDVIATLEAVRTFEADIGLSLAAPLLRRSLFSVPKLGALNLHKRKVPDFRSMPPAFNERFY